MEKFKNWRNLCSLISNDWRKILLWNIDIFWQKIFDILNWDIFHREILTRVGNVWIDCASSTDKFLLNLTKQSKIDFDWFVIEKIFKYLHTCNKNWKDITKLIFNLNIDPNTLWSPFFKNILNNMIIKYNIITNNIRFEITENWKLDNNDILNLNANIKFLQWLWFKVWIDDYPNENNNNKLLDIIEWLDFVKIDKSFILDYNSWLLTKEQFLHIIWKIIEDIFYRMWNQINIVIEWIEDSILFEFVKKEFWDKIRYYQWYFFQIPEKLII